MYIKDIEKQKKDRRQEIIDTINARAYISNRNRCYPPYSTPQYQNPALFFWAINENLRILGTNLELNMTSIDELSPYRQREIKSVLGDSWWEEPLQDVYFYLETLQFSEYYNALLAFKWAAHLISFPLFEQYNCVQMIDGKLFCRLSNQNELKDDYTRIVRLSNGLYLYKYDPQKSVKKGEQGEGLLLLTDEIVGGLIRLNGGQKDFSLRKKKDLGKHLVELHEDDPYAKRNRLEGEKVVRYREGVLEYVPTMAKVRFSQKNVPELIYLPSLGGYPEEAKPSKRLENTLLSLTNGDLDKLDVLAEFLARTFCISAPSKYLWYVHGNSAAFAQWVEKMVEGKTCSTVYNPKLTQARMDLIYDQIKQHLIQFNSDPISATEFAKLNHSKLNGYINGGEIIVVDDPYQIKETESYYPLVAFFSEGNSMDTEKAFRSLPYKEINVPDGWTSKDLSREDFQWLKICLVAKGLQLIQGYERRKVQSEQINIDHVVRRFANDFCKRIKDSRTGCKTFYKALKNYLDTLPYDGKLEGSTKTTEYVAALMNWECKDDRKNKNRKAFWDIYLDEDKLNAAIEENKAKKEQEQQERAARSFHEYLNEITELVIWS
ncbi:MAG: hypothetical protein NC319_00070 [Butyricicoccus sp.]|nr:hypothetical protein [Butyricicoccus sp.]